MCAFPIPRSIRVNPTVPPGNTVHMITTLNNGMVLGSIGSQDTLPFGLVFNGVYPWNTDAVKDIHDKERLYKLVLKKLRGT